MFNKQEMRRAKIQLGKTFLLGIVSLGASIATLAQPGSDKGLNKILQIVHGGLRLSVQQYDGTKLVAKQVFQEGNILATPGGRWQMNLAATKVANQPDA